MEQLALLATPFLYFFIMTFLLFFFKLHLGLPLILTVYEIPNMALLHGVSNPNNSNYARKLEPVFTSPSLRNSSQFSILSSFQSYGYSSLCSFLWYVFISSLNFLHSSFEKI